MLAALLISVALGAEPKAKPAAQVTLADYLSEVREVINVALKEKTQQKAQAALAKGVKELNAKYNKSKAKLTLTRRTRPIEERNSNVALEIPEEPAGDAGQGFGLKYQNFYQWKFIVNSPEKLDGKAIQWRGIPQLYLGNGKGEINWKFNKQEFGIKLMDLKTGVTVP